MKKRLLTAGLALALSLGLFSVPALAYRDVTETDWQAPCIQEVTDLGLMEGIGSDLFRPEGTLTRAMAVTVLWRLAGEPESAGSSPFTDVAADTWYTQAVTWAAETGAVNGVSATRFAPNSPVTREQLAVMVYRYAQGAGYAVTNQTALTLTDRKTVSDWATDAVTWAMGSHFLTPRQLTEAPVPFPLIQPAQAATRSEVAVFLSRFALSAPEESQLTPAVLTAVQEGSQGLSLVITTGSEDNSGGDAALSLSVRVDARGQATYTCTRIQNQTGTAAPAESLTYDDQGRLVQVVDTANRTTYTIQYDGRGNPAFVTISPDFLEQTVYAFHYTAGESSWQWAAVAQDGANLLAL